MTGTPGGILGELVHQFTDPYALYRELVQNSIDAGSRRIEVVLRYEPGRDGGMASASVRDWGEGMTREIIESYLLTKFRSTKEGDLTKIGRFGIGFMSVFALKPDLVVVETGRDGEDWRLLLHPDHRYELLVSPTPSDGTNVTLHRQMHVTDYRELVLRSRQALSRWCRHSSVDVAFAAGGPDGGAPPAPALVREPFTVDAPFVVESKDEHIHIVAGPSRSPTPLHGFYNRGLTLLESLEPFAPSGGDNPVAPAVTFKVMSHLLEHTLTRDSVRHDDGFERVVKKIRDVVEGPLHERLVHELRTAAEHGAGGDYDALLRCAVAGKRGLRGEADIHFPLAAGGSVDGRTLARRAKVDGAVLLASAMAAGASPDPVVGALAREKIPVLARTPQIAEAASRIAGKEAREAVDHFALALPARRPTEGEQALLDGLARLGTATGWHGKQVAMAPLRGAAVGRMHALVESIGTPISAARALRSPRERPCPPLLCLDPDHVLVQELASLAARKPRLAALLCLRLIAAAHGGLQEKAERASLEASLAESG